MDAKVNDADLYRFNGRVVCFYPECEKLPCLIRAYFHIQDYLEWWRFGMNVETVCNSDYPAVDYSVTQLPEMNPLQIESKIRIFENMVRRPELIQSRLV